MFSITVLEVILIELILTMAGAVATTTITGHLAVGPGGRLQETVAVDLYDGVAPAAASGRGRGGRGGRGRGRTLLLF